MSVDRWLEIVQCYVSGSRNLANDKNSLPAGLFAWQSTEASLKALCVGHSIPHSHDLSGILMHIESNNLMKEEELKEIRIMQEL